MFIESDAICLVKKYDTKSFVVYLLHVFNYYDPRI